jgi:arylsulfatase A-like enzyme
MNVVVILADDLGYAGIGAQGCTDIPTPRIDSLAKEGVRCTQGYVTCPVCAPTRAGLLTGRYQERFGFEHNPGPAPQEGFGLPRDQPTLAERLKAAGYATGMVGKWHLGQTEGLRPPERGFDSYFGFLAGAHPYFPGGPRAAPILRGTEPVVEKDYLTRAFAREAKAFVEANKETPFLLYLAFNAVHTPMDATPEDLERTKAIEDPRRRTHAAMVVAMDDAVGAVLDALREHGLDEKTLVFFLSDNGGPTPQTTSSNAPLRGFKGQVYEGGIRVPFLVRWKGRVPAGGVYDKPVVSLDIVATALAAAGVGQAEELDGVDLLPHLAGKAPAPPHDRLFWRFGEQAAARVGDWKLVMRGGASELYHLSDDVAEATNLAATEPEKLKELRAAYDAWAAGTVPAKWGRSNRRASPGFQAADKNGDGVLTPDELARPRLFRRMDADGDGKVTREEFDRARG